MSFFTADAFLYSWVLAGFALAGGLFAFFIPANPRLLACVAHLISGIVLAAVAKELVPRVAEEMGMFSTIIGFSLGALFMLGLRFLLNKLKSTNNFMLTIASMLDLFFDGFFVAMSFYIAYQTGLLFAFSLAGCALFLAFYLSHRFLERAVPKVYLIILLIALALMPPAAAVCFEFLSDLFIQGQYQTEILSFATAALLYLAVEELMRQAHQQKESFLSSIAFFVGFILIVLF